jgi:hypothetical protein
MSALSFARSHQSPQCGFIVELSVLPAAPDGD